MVLVVSFFIVLFILLAIDMSEQEILTNSLEQLEEMASADLIVLRDEDNKELFRYEGVIVKEKAEVLLKISTFEELYQKKISRVAGRFFMTISFYDQTGLLGIYQLVEVLDVSELGGIEEKIMIINKKPCFLEFNKRFWTLGETINVG